MKVIKTTCYIFLSWLTLDTLIYYVDNFPVVANKVIKPRQDKASSLVTISH